VGVEAALAFVVSAGFFALAATVINIVERHLPVLVLAAVCLFAIFAIARSWGVAFGTEAGEQHLGRVGGGSGGHVGSLARGLGLETETVVDALGGSPLVSPPQAAKLQRIAKGEFSPQFALSLALKDVRLALQAADGDRLAVLACLADEWQQVVDHGLGDQDLTVVTRALEQHGGTP
jgi:hypothetical protein